MIDAGFENIVKKIAEEKGKDIFLEPKKLKSLLLDYAKNEFKKECSLLTSILDTDSVNFINRAENLEDCKKFLVKRLEDEHSLSPQKSAEMLDLLFFVFHGVKLEPLLFDSDVSKFSQISTKENNINYKLRPLHSFKSNSFLHCVAFSPNNKYVISGGMTGGFNGLLLLWDIETRQLIYKMGEEYKDCITSVAFISNGEFVISDLGDIRLHLVLWDIKNGKSIRHFNDDDISDICNCVTFSPDGKYVIFTDDDDGTIKLWDIWEDKKGILPRVFRGHDKEVISLAFSPNGQYFISLSCDNTLKLWNVKNCSLIRTFTGHELDDDPNGTVSFSPNGLFFASGANDGIKLWNVENEHPIFTTPPNTVNDIHSIAFSPMGDFIVSGSSNGSLILWKIENGSFNFKSIEMHKGCVTSVVFSPDGKYIASASIDGIVNLWRLI